MKRCANVVRRYGLVGCRLAAFAIASALMLAGASGAVAVADPGAESAARTDGNHRADDGNHRADSGSVGSETGDHSASTTRGSGGNGKGRGGRPGDDQTSNGGRQPRSGQSGGRKPAGAESGAGTRPGDARPPTRLPAPPPEDPAPPPTDLPPVDKGVPVEAEVRDAATAAVPGEAGRVSTGSVISVPASPPASPPNGLGPSVASRGIASPPAPETARGVDRVSHLGARVPAGFAAERPRAVGRIAGDSESTGTRGRTGVDRVSHLGARVPAGFAAERPRAVGRIAGDSESTGTRDRTGVDRVSHLVPASPPASAAERPRAVGRIAVG